MKNEDFTKSTKKQKLEMETIWLKEPIKISRLLFIPIRKKMDGWGMSACFVNTSDGWIRLGDYDCFRFEIDGDSKYKALKGDFQYGGVAFFFGDNVTIDYGNTIKITY